MYILCRRRMRHLAETRKRRKSLAAVTLTLLSFILPPIGLLINMLAKRSCLQGVIYIITIYPAAPRGSFQNSFASWKALLLFGLYAFLW